MKLAPIYTLFLLAAGCGAADPTLSADEEDLTTSFTYTCRVVHHSNAAAKVRVSKTKAKLTVVDTKELVAPDGSFTYDPSYKPHNPSFVGRARYWHPTADDNTVLIMEPEIRTGGYALKIGGHGGFVTVEGGSVGGQRVDLLCQR